MNKLSHLDNEGRPNMVDVSGKKIQHRSARAEGYIELRQDTINLIRDSKMKKGNVLSVAELAGIQAAKKTSEIIPLCHPLQITKIDVKADLVETGVRVEGFAKCIGQTGIEMEVLTSVFAALLTIYDMCKAVDKEMVIYGISLLEKTKSDDEIGNY
jgi:cyclic pyranopterin monophosphate synthase